MIGLYYIERKNGTNHDGLAWIGFIRRSKRQGRQFISIALHSLKTTKHGL